MWIRKRIYTIIMYLEQIATSNDKFKEHRFGLKQEKKRELNLCV